MGNKSGKHCQKHHTSIESKSQNNWSCAVCTYENNVLLEYCEMCGKLKSKSHHSEQKISTSTSTSDEKFTPRPVQIPSYQSCINELMLAGFSREDAAMAVQMSNMDETNNLNQAQQTPQVSNSNLAYDNQYESHLAQYWQCSSCLFAENQIESPVCQKCKEVPAIQPPETKESTDTANMSKWRALVEEVNHRKIARDHLQSQYLLN
eukprot:188545_1